MTISASKQSSNDDTIHNRKKAVKRVIETVNDKLDEPLTMTEMAEIAYMSPFHFNRVFHQITGLPPKQFLYAMRIEYAKRLLLTTNKSVTEICFDVGYNSLGTFTSRFTQLVGLSPRELRYLADEIQTFDWDKFYDTNWNEIIPSDSQSSLSGEIRTPNGFEGLIFVGLFEQMIPQSQPVSGTLLKRGGRYLLSSVPQGTFNLLVAALPRSESPIDYLLLDISTLLVGVGKVPITMKPQANETNLTIRNLRVTDPPILTALPFLLSRELKRLKLKDFSK